MIFGNKIQITRPIACSATNGTIDLYMSIMVIVLGTIAFM